MEAGGLANAFGNGVAYPFTVIYLHNLRGFSLGIAGLVLTTNAIVSPRPSFKRVQPACVPRA